MDEMQSGFSVSNMSGFSGSNDYMESSPAVENNSGFKDSIPPGFRFLPTDEELITQYLCKKIIGESIFCTVAIGEVDLNKVEPWEIPDVCVGEREWYFFSLKDRKYPTGLRTNRATHLGYWKATGKDREIFKGKILVGMKKTLVFYKGRAPKGERTDWVMHEYRSEAKHNLPQNAKNEWVICKVFKKSSMEKKADTSGIRAENCSQEPSLMMLNTSLMNLLQTMQTSSNVEYESFGDSINVGMRHNLKDNSGLWVKVGYNNDIVMFMLPLATMDSLKKEILKRYNKLEGESIKIRYKDEDEEMVTIACDEDLHYCLEIFKSTGRAPVRLSLFKE